MWKNKLRYLSIILSFCLIVLSTTTACVDTSKSNKETTTESATTKKETKKEKSSTEKETTQVSTTTKTPTTTPAPTTTPVPTTTPTPTTEPPTTLPLDMSVIPAYSGAAYIVINGNVPYFTDSDKVRTDAFETYSDCVRLPCRDCRLRSCRVWLQRSDKAPWPRCQTWYR